MNNQCAVKAKLAELTDKINSLELQAESFSSDIVALKLERVKLSAMQQGKPYVEFYGHVWDVNGAIPYLYDNSVSVYVNAVYGGFVGVFKDHNTGEIRQTGVFYRVACDNAAKCAASKAYDYYLLNKGD